MLILGYFSKRKMAYQPKARPRRFSKIENDEKAHCAYSEFFLNSKWRSGPMLVRYNFFKIENNQKAQCEYSDIFLNPKWHSSRMPVQDDFPKYKMTKKPIAHTRSFF